MVGRMLARKLVIVAETLVIRVALAATILLLDQPLRAQTPIGPDRFVSATAGNDLVENVIRALLPISVPVVSPSANQYITDLKLCNITSGGARFLALGVQGVQPAAREAPLLAADDCKQAL